MMRALIMDFVKDRNALDINNEYMFGKSLLVCPVTQPLYVDTVVSGKDTSRIANFGNVKTTHVYLPAGTGWYDFWTGEKHDGGHTVNKVTPIDMIPLYVKAGSVIFPSDPKCSMPPKRNGRVWKCACIRELMASSRCTKMKRTTTIMRREPFPQLPFPGMMRRKL